MSELLKNNDFHFQKKYGQNFLQDVKIPRRIAVEGTAYPIPEDGSKIKALMLEIGPGAGILTKELADRYEKVVAVEIDESLRPVLAEALKDHPNAEVVFGDVMETDLVSLLEEKRKGENGERLPVSVCANLPYYITTPILMKLVEEYPDFDYITVMVQKEVAVRLASKPGSSEYGAITAVLGLYGTVKRLFAVPSGCFVPRPKVDSAVVCLSLHKPPKYTAEQIKKTSEVIRAAFSMRRKTLTNALGAMADGDKAFVAECIRNALGLPETVRGETLNTEQFVRLAEEMRK